MKWCSRPAGWRNFAVHVGQTGRFLHFGESEFTPCKDSQAYIVFQTVCAFSFPFVPRCRSPTVRFVFNPNLETKRRKDMIRKKSDYALNKGNRQTIPRPHKSGRRGWLTPVLPHHRSCGPASGGSVTDTRQHVWSENKTLRDSAIPSVTHLSSGRHPLSSNCNQHV